MNSQTERHLETCSVSQFAVQVVLIGYQRSEA